MSAKDLFYEKGHEFNRAEKMQYARDELIYNTTEDLLVLLEDLGLSKSDLAERLGKSRAYVSQLLSGARNMTLGTFSDICFVLGYKAKVACRSDEEADDRLEGSSHQISWTESAANAKSWQELISDNFEREVSEILVGNNGLVRSDRSVIDRTERKHWEQKAA